VDFMCRAKPNSAGCGMRLIICAREPVSRGGASLLKDESERREGYFPFPPLTPNSFLASLRLRNHAKTSSREYLHALPQRITGILSRVHFLTAATETFKKAAISFAFSSLLSMSLSLYIRQHYHSYRR
jgi:hypothetical protein